MFSYWSNWVCGLGQYHGLQCGTAADADDAAKAEAADTFYGAAISDTFPKWIKNIEKEKSVFGICVHGGCTWGKGPDSSVITAWTEFSKDNGGMML